MEVFSESQAQIDRPFEREDVSQVIMSLVWKVVPPMNLLILAAAKVKKTAAIRAWLGLEVKVDLCVVFLPPEYL